MKKKLGSSLCKGAALGAVSAMAFAAAQANAQSVTTSIYATFTDNGGGTPYSDFVGSFNTFGVSFATDNAYNWHPFGLETFGADITGCIEILSSGDHTFSLDSDDGSLLFIDGNLVVDNGGSHPPTVANGLINLAAGVHTFEVQFFEDFGGPSGVDLHLPTDARFVDCVPEVGIMTPAGIAVGLALLQVRRRRPAK